MKKMLTILAVSVFMVAACSKTTTNNPEPGDCNGTAKSFAADVSPVIQSSCAIGSGCHGSGSQNGPGVLANYSQVSSARTAIRSAIISGRMPVNGSLSAAQKNAIICWIDNGAPNN
ncbi:MAG TPA: hypothetical protein VFX58_07110 [Chitinophagaceae bacterium]|nr:hypothetical protein [Chitinophagaceae bacterium]